MATDLNNAAITILRSNNFKEAEKLCHQSASKAHQIRIFQTLLFGINPANHRKKSALKIAQHVIDVAPNHWKGYALAARLLDDLGSTKAAIRTVRAGLQQRPKNRRLLKIACKLYDKIGNRKQALKYKLKLALRCPKKVNLQVQTAHGLMRLGRIKKAKKILAKATASTSRNKQLIDTEQNINHFINTNQHTFNQQQTPPLICIAGNCQIQPIAEWLKKSFPFSQIECLQPYHLIEHQSTINTWLEAAKKADLIFMIPIKDGYNGFNFGSEQVFQERSQKSLFISYPSFHFEAFYPLFGYAKTKTGTTLRGTDLEHSGHLYDDYHDFLALWLSQHCDSEIQLFCDAICFTDQDHYQGSAVIHDAAIDSFRQFSTRYPSYVDILKNDIASGIAHTFNHPDNQFLQAMYFKIWTQTLKHGSSDFVPYTKDPLNQLQLPIPSFVTRSLSSQQFEHPWKTTGRIQARTSLQNYLLELETSIDTYRTNPDILTDNANHPKLALAGRFMSELMMQSVRS